ncbi:cytochrome c oxidase subunit 5b-1, mitochondrial-like [Rosa chinensis]|uniref:cytochrome c oxidase subunit 5b-1, mitochondrial-like n=1 Tax=Rosa chinensis TaxID=74649 RepID=UPI000D08AAC3|nr:cytochrome c oxidase subunit 5b-1, mitochondrial-like [Rosa chinensis]
MDMVISRRSFSDDIVPGTKHDDAIRLHPQDMQKSDSGSSDSLDSLFGDKDAISALEEAPAIVKSYYDKRIVGCLGDEGGTSHIGLIFLTVHKGFCCSLGQ